MLKKQFLYKLYISIIAITILLVTVFLWNVINTDVTTIKIDNIRTFAQNDNLDDLKDKMNQLDDELSEIKDKIKQLNNEKKSAESKKNAILTIINELNKQQAILADKIIVESDNLVVKQTMLDEKIIQMNKEQELLEDRMISMYKKQNQGVVSGVLGTSDLSEILTSSVYMQRVAVADTELVDKLNNERIAIETEKKQIEVSITNLEATKKEMEASEVAEAAALREIDASITEIEAAKQAADANEKKVYDAYNAAKKEFDKLAWQNSNNGMGSDFVSGQFAWPVPGFNYISSGFGNRLIFGYWDYHTGIDIAGGGRNIYGQPICASAYGKVVTVGYAPKGYGRYVIIDHGGSFKTLYAHASSITVQVGALVNQGDVIGAVGSTGWSSGPHLHFEIRVNNKAQNPTNYL